jgi:chemotaxis protein MotB
MSGDSNVAPVIIKRKKVVGGDGHHGGAWKVAYADFVTAMMAFFLLMWLLNATTEKQRKGIADYFSPTVAMARVSGGGDGALGGSSVFAENVLPRVGTGATSLRPQAENREAGAGNKGSQDEQQSAETTEAEDQTYMLVEEKLVQLGKESVVTEDLLRNMDFRITDEGLVIELFESESVRLFEGEATPTGTLRALANVLVEAAGIVTNPIAIEGHTAAYPVVLAQNPSWDVSGQRAAAFRDLIAEAGLDQQRVQRLTAHADREPSRQNRMDVRNNRLEVVFIRRTPD